VPGVRTTLGRLTQALLEFNVYVSDFDIGEHIAPENLGVFTILSDEYKAVIAAAEKRAEEESENDEAVHCNNCFNRTAARKDNGYECFYCEFSDPILDCSVCGIEERKSEMSEWNEEYDDYICQSCEDRINNM
jgi:hypothetical protein